MEKKSFKAKESSLQLLLCILAVGMLVLSLVPMLSIAKYDYPYTDDTRYGDAVTAAFNDDPTIGTALSAAAEVVIETYQTWQGTFSAIFLMALQPGVFSLSAYQITPYIMIGSLIVSTMLFLYTLICSVLHAPKRVWLLVGAAVLFFSIQLLASAHQGFYWYNGSVYYTFFHSLMLVAMSLIIRMFLTRKMVAKIVHAALIVLLCAILSGGNYATIMIFGEFLVCALAYAVWKKRYRALIVLAVAAVVLGAGLWISVMAPGNAVRQAQVSQSNPIKAIFMSLAYGAGAFMQWFDSGAITVCALAILFIGPYIETLQYRFQHPLVVVLILFCAFSSMFTPSAYSMSSSGPHRYRNIVYFVFLLMVLVDTVYITGWLQHHRRPTCPQEKTMQERNRFLTWLVRYPMAAVVLLALMVGSALLQNEVMTTPSVLAVTEIMDGTAAEYGEVRLADNLGTVTEPGTYRESKLLS